MSTQDFLARSAFNDLANSIEQALSDTEGFRDEAENFADLARRGIRLVPPGVVADLSSFPANPEGGDAVLVESEDQIYFFDSDSSTWKDSKIIGSAIFANIQGDPSDNTALQTALDGIDSKIADSRLIAFDRFQRADGSLGNDLLSNEWKFSGSAYEIVNGRARTTSSSTPPNANIAYVELANTPTSLRLQTNQLQAFRANPHGIVISYVDPDNYWIFVGGHFDWQIRKIENGSSATIHSQTAIEQQMGLGEMFIRINNDSSRRYVLFDGTELLNPVRFELSQSDYDNLNLGRNNVGIFSRSANELIKSFEVW